MKKIKSIKIEKIWGYEIWLHSPLSFMQTEDEDGNKTTDGLLVKIIKANDPLSVQVHPDDDLAKELENQSNGKSESWYILESQDDSYLYLGTTTQDKSKLQEAIINNNLEKFLNKVKPEAKQFYNIEAGLVHAIGNNVTLLEVQQPSDVTYRYYDYGRKNEDGSTRELHIEKALKSQKDLSYKVIPTNKEPLVYKNSYSTQEFHNKPSTLNNEAIVVDLLTYNCYKVKKDELIKLKQYAVIY